MKILDTRILRGPNFWSISRKKLIQIKVDLGIAEYCPTDKIENFSEDLERLIPSLSKHFCSVGEPGGFLKRVKEGTWMGHVIEHIALELQSLADMDCGYGRTRSTGERGVYYIVFSYELENAGLYAGQAAFRIVESIISKRPYDLENDIEELSRIKRNEGLGPSTLSIVAEAEKRNIPWRRLDDNSLIMLGYGCNQKIMDATVASTTSAVAADLVSDKDLTKKILSGLYVTFPDSVVIQNKSDLNEAINELGFPVVIKPLDGNHGNGVTTKINSYDQAHQAFEFAKLISDYVIVEKYIHGNDYRFLVINYKVAAVALRTPAMILGDGISTIQILIDKINRDPKRGKGHENILTKISINSETELILKERGLDLQSVLNEGEILFLKNTANISTGGTAFDVTDSVHPDNVILAERISRLVGLNICGLDIIANDITVPITKETGALIEINAAPGFRMHLFPVAGKPQNVAAPVLDMLFPNNAPSRIPIVAITGTNGKTTTTRLIAHLAKAEGYNPGYTTTDGVYLNNDLIYSGDCSGPESAATVLRDPSVNFAVLECARGGILRAGLGFDKCDVSIVTNVTNDHLGLKDIHTLEDLAKVKSVLPRSTDKNGYAILNADDDLVYKMREDIDCNLALFSMDPSNPRIKAHCAKGGIAAVIDDNRFVIYKNKLKIIFPKICDVPLTFAGTAEFMIQNILPAILVPVILNFSLTETAQALKTFYPSPLHTPGRMNLFRFKNFKVLADYAHNEGGFIELKKYLQTQKASVKTGVISATGDRRDEDIRKLGSYAAQMFDEIIIKFDRDCRGRTEEELTHLIIKGIIAVKPEMSVRVIGNENDAIKLSLENAKKDSFIVIYCDDVNQVLKLLAGELEKEDSPGIEALTLLNKTGG